MDQYRATYKRLEGRRAILHDIFVKNPIAKPMFMECDDCISVAQMLAARNSMSELEYITAFVVLLHDEEVYDIRDFRDMFHHLHSVTDDSLTIPWPAVRSCLQRVFDRVECKRLSLNDRQGITHTTTSLDDKGARI